MPIDDTLDATLSALESGPKSIPVSAAIENISTWEAELSSVSSASGIVSDLGKLKTLLQSTSPNDSEITSLLQKLSTSTSSAASSAPSDVAPKLKQLGQLLAG